MQAIQPVTPVKPPVQLRSRRFNHQVVQQRRSQRHRAHAIEASVKLVTNVLLSACVVSALVQILPYYRSAEEKLSQIQSEVKLTRERVGAEQADFHRHFDPQQTASIMQEYSNRVAPGQRQVIWLEDFTVEQTESANSPEYAGLH
ncbi:MAG: hypothetical protein WAN66_28625 [Limnoraphis robusta]|jgi:hypothetical protein|uniref:Uncharacterized protein n=2 Tax=Limnoraphis robusta TaxID=1118279 RepID=A0A0F5YE87_9CYAN|nr:hypothetical protein [Limnoraphis robusta]KKD37181.1 hypothetical protein WN50_15785 [Limnoraphis robusta CS-951]MEA5501470.1 hypothetical protein [Limnoraphis robusta BA-68 BA1]MEA5519609.1 hypothetical protein [Limnoraphis robusta CCNP1315]MEA5542084.1 hypothetical protein [Limnoraphis robusta Tam1]MEA5549298.1 hypothetical protein [Limnoraphis robusta CCNP1324]